MKKINRRLENELLPFRQQGHGFDGYDADMLMKETAKLRKLITRRGTLEILIPLCCTTNPVRYIKFKNTLKGFRQQDIDH